MSDRLADRAHARALLAEQAAARVRYEAERAAHAHPAPRVDSFAIAASIRAQLARDEIAAAREALRPDFATSCRIAANRRQHAAIEPGPRIARTIADADTSLPSLRRDFIGPVQPEAAERQHLAVITAEVKSLRKRLAKAEAAAIELQTFIGPRTPAGAAFAVTLHASHLANSKRYRAALEDIHPAFAKLRAHLRTDELTAALAEFVDESEQHTGMSMSPDEYAKQVNKKARLREMSAEICRRLASVGVETKREDGCGLWTYWIHSGVWEEIEQYRRICINPVVAAATRAPILAALEYFIQETDFCRFWTFTTGLRCTVSEIGERLDTYSRKLSKLNHVLRKKWGIEIVIASTEFGTLEKETGDSAEGGGIEFVRLFDGKTGLHRDEPLYHPHFHCVIRSTIGYRPKAEWTEACEFVRSFWGHHCDFDGVIKSPREIVKYVSKPGDLLKLTPLQLKAFYEATANRRLVRPMGALRQQIAARKSRDETLRRVRTNGGKSWKWVEKIDHNKTLRDTISPETQAEMDAIVDSQHFAAECAAAENALSGMIEIGETLTLWDDGTATRESAGMMRPDGLPVRLKDKPNFCQVVAFIPPAAGPTMRKENRVIVMGNRRDVGAVNRHPLVKQLRERTWTAWAAGEALAGAEAAFADASGIYVHTGTVSVPDELQTPHGWRVDDPIQLVFETA